VDEVARFRKIGVFGKAPSVPRHVVGVLYEVLKELGVHYLVAGDTPYNGCFSYDDGSLDGLNCATRHYPYSSFPRCPALERALHKGVYRLAASCHFYLLSATARGVPRTVACRRCCRRSGCSGLFPCRPQSRARRRNNPSVLRIPCCKVQCRKHKSSAFPGEQPRLSPML